MLAATVVIWALNFTVTRYVLNHGFHPLAYSVVRYGLAATLFASFTYGRERSFRDVWESSPWLQKIRGIRARDLHTCGGCSRLAYCGRCHAQALAEDGDLYGPSTYARERADLIDAAGAAPGAVPNGYRTTSPAVAAGVG